MRLTPEEFSRIRQLRWKTRYIGDKVYNTPSNDIETKLFWLDFMRLVFAPRYKTQYGITEIQKFDQTQPVLLTDSLELIVPTQLESAMYFSDNKKEPPVRFQIPVVQLFVLIVAIVVLAGIVVFDFWKLNRVSKNKSIQ